MSKANQKLYGTGLLGDSLAPMSKSSLKRDFVMPPFSTLNQRDGEWAIRKRNWIELGIQSEIGRDVVTYHVEAFNSDKYGKGVAQTSIFDPVLCEILYHWYCPPQGRILDPFAGGSVRGIVASVMGYRYYGIDLSAKQIAANKEQLNDNTTGDFDPVWKCGDAHECVEDAPACDMVFACPPYGNLERYSDDPRDISTMEYDEFLHAYSLIIERCCDRLRNNRYAVFVVGNFRARKTGWVIDFVGDTIRSFEYAGLNLYNDAVLISPCGTGAVRVSNNFERGKRKLVRLHQSVLVFCKGKPMGEWT